MDVEEKDNPAGSFDRQHLAPSLEKAFWKRCGIQPVRLANQAMTHFIYVNISHKKEVVKTETTKFLWPITHIIFVTHISSF